MGEKKERDTERGNDPIEAWVEIVFKKCLSQMLVILLSPSIPTVLFSLCFLKLDSCFQNFTWLFWYFLEWLASLFPIFSSTAENGSYFYEQVLIKWKHSSLLFLMQLYYGRLHPKANFKRVKLNIICIDAIKKKDKIMYIYEFDELHVYIRAYSSQISFDLESQIPI